MSRLETQRSISEWAEATFGAHGSNVVVATRANEEMAELLSCVAKDEGASTPNPKIIEEIADVFICLYRLADRMGSDVHEAIDRKMAVNRARRWNVDTNGVGQHVGD